ncbi:cell wall-binding repeat-containing protein [Clostridium rectalis]|uniref:cell wall-binding repeat-containing protein n=1 Tax=Clostridium rectalis TaxID=2040295 RepID=UPI000F62D2BA|nr:cell wall-binding repeat-containing protein [Clostridium rectalis]
MGKIMALILSVAIILSGESVLAGKKDYNISRIGGKNRYETSINIAKNYSNKKLKNVIITSGNNFPDALSGTMLLNKLKAPILLVNKNVRDSRETTNFIINNLTEEGCIYILGEKDIVDETFEYYFKHMGFKNIKRLGGENRFATNKSIVKFLNVEKKTPLFITNGFGFADALSLSFIAAKKGYPVIISNKEKLPNEAIDILEDIKPSKIFLVGGEAVIGDSIIDELTNFLPYLNREDITRISGENRYDTCLNICEEFGVSRDTAIITNGNDFPDALSVSALSVKTNAPVILINDNYILNQKEYLDNNNYKNLILIGGAASINTESQRVLENKPVISDKDVKRLIFNCDEILKNIFKIEVNSKDYINIKGISYAPLKENLNKYNSIYKYLDNNFKLKNYYTDDFINNMISYIFKNIDGKYYIRYGNPTPRINIKDAKIEGKKYEGSKLYISLRGYYLDSLDEWSLKITLIYNGKGWIVSKYNNWF